MNPYSISKIIDHFDFSETLRSHLLQNHSTLNFETEEDLFSFILMIGNEGEMSEKAEELIFELEERINIVKHKLKFIEESQKPSVLILSEVIPPVFENNNHLIHLIETAGAKMYDAEVTETESFNPDVILVVSEQMERLFGGLANLLMSEEWQQTNAIKNNRVFLIDGSTNLQGFNLNLASDIEILAEILYPQYLTFGGRGESWLQFEI